MKTVAIINLKGGVAKTTTAVSLAELLAEGDKRRKRPGSRVLLFDNDKQGNASRIFGTYEREQEAGACRIIKTGRIAGNIRDTEVENMDIVTCNYFMELAELEIKADTVNTQHGRYKSALGEIDGKYDFCIIDNPPDLGMNVINAMVAADEIIIPVCLDAYSLDGLEELVEQINQIRALNPKTRLAGVLITDYEKSDTSEAAESWIRAKSGCPVFSQKIRHGILVIVEFDIAEYRRKNRSRAVKKTLSIPEWLNEAAIRENLNFSQVLQDALMAKLGMNR